MMELIDDLDGARIKNIAQKVIGKLSTANGFFLIVKKHLSEKNIDISEVINNIDRIDNDVAYAISRLNFLINNIPEPAELEGVMLDIIKQKRDKYKNVGIDYNETQQKYQVDQRVLDVVNDILDIAIKLCKNNRINIEIQKNNDSNIKIIISEMEISDFHFTAESLEKFRKYINSLTIRIIKEVGNGDIFEITSPILFQHERGKIMIIELLTAQTIGAGMKFLFDRLGKLVDRKNDELLARIKNVEEAAKVAESAKNEQNLELAKESMRNLRKINPEIDSMNSFADWIQAKIDEDFANLLEVDELLVVVLRRKREEESNQIKKANFLKIEAKLKTQLNNFKNGGGVFEEKEQEQLYGLIMNVLGFLRK